MKSSKKIQNVIKLIPTLTHRGVLDCSDKNALKFEQLQLLKSGEQFQRLCDWIGKSYLEKIKSINTDNANSYHLKHLDEKDIGYVSNGLMIAALIHLGFQYQLDGGLNVDFAISKRSINRIYKKHRREHLRLVSVN